MSCQDPNVLTAVTVSGPPFHRSGCQDCHCHRLVAALLLGNSTWQLAQKEYQKAPKKQYIILWQIVPKHAGFPKCTSHFPTLSTNHKDMKLSKVDLETKVQLLMAGALAIYTSSYWMLPWRIVQPMESQLIAFTRPWWNFNQTQGSLFALLRSHNTCDSRGSAGYPSLLSEQLSSAGCRTGKALMRDPVAWDSYCWRFVK